MKLVRAWVHKKLLQLNNTFQTDKFAEYNIQVQNGVPVGVKKIKDKERKQEKNTN